MIFFEKITFSIAEVSGLSIYLFENPNESKMEIPTHILENLTELYRNRYFGSEEIEILEAWLKDVDANPEVERWLSYNWNRSDNKDIDISFDAIRTRIERNRLKSSRQAIRVFIRNFQKVAAFLVVPISLISIYLLIERNFEPLPMTLVTAKGERTHIYLPDSSEVWLNVDSKLQYATDYLAANRDLTLDGEAFFKVAKGKKFPFKVHTRKFCVTAIGCKIRLKWFFVNFGDWIHKNINSTNNLISTI